MPNTIFRIFNTSIIERFDLQVTLPGQSVNEEFELDSNVQTIHGLLLTSDREDLLFYRGSQKVTINSFEVFPELYESKLLLTALGVSPMDRFHEIDFLAGNRKIDVRYQDTNHSKALFEPYRVSLYVFSNGSSPDI